MAKSGILEPIPGNTLTELKKELNRLVTAILDEEDCSLEIINDAIRILTALSDLKIKKSFDSLKVVVDNNAIPDEFKCPISGQLMNDPVVLSSGQTYDRPSIQKQQNDGLSETFIIPNLLVQEIISRWCRQRGIQLPNPAKDADENVVTDANRSFLNSLIEKLSSSSLSDQMEAAKRLRMLTKKNPKFRIIFGKCPDTISKLVYPLMQISPNAHPDLQENLITTILNISIPVENKVLVAEHPLVIPLLIDSLEVGTMEARSNAAAALFTLSALDSIKLSIGKLGAFKPLINLLEEGKKGAIKDAATAIFSLCIAPENRVRAVREGAVRVIFRKILDGILVDELIAIIAMLANYPEAVVELVKLNAVSHLLCLMRDEHSVGNKENSVVILYAICLNDRTKLSEIREEEDANRTLSKLATHGSSRAKRKAEGILSWLEKADSYGQTA